MEPYRIQNILIVDDQKTNLKLLKVQLESFGYIVFEASDGMEALEVLEKRKVEVIISDILMPNMHGYEFCAKVRADKALDSVVFIFYTATMTLKSEEQFALKLGADAFFRKPTSLTAMLEVIQGIAKDTQHRILTPLIQSTESILREYSQSIVNKFEDQNAMLIEKNNLLTHEIGERKKAEEDGKRQSVFFRMLFESSPIGLVMVHTDNSVIAANRMFTEIFQYSAEDLIGNNLSDFISPNGKSNESKELLEQAILGSILPIQIVRMRKDKSLVEILFHMYPFIVDNEPIALCGVYVDQTNQKSLEKQLRQSQKLESLGTLASSIAHDFNNILTIILGHTGLLESKSSDKTKLLHSIQIIQNASERGASIVRQLLTFARKTEMIYRSVMLNDIVREIENLLQDTFPKTIVIKSDLDSDISYISADAGQIHQLLLNLCINAKDSIQEIQRIGAITISTKEVAKEIVLQIFPNATEHSYIRIRVSDTGAGMTEETIQRVFEPFFTTKGEEKGTGLGLSVVYGIVENHHGFIDFRSKVGTGTTCTVYFPSETNVSKSKNSDKEESSYLVKKRAGTILLVEDEEFIREFTKEVLTEVGYNVISTENGREALSKFEQHKDEIFLVISDLDIPIINGDEVCIRIFALKPEMKIIVASGYISSDVKQSLYDWKDQIRYVQKPFRPSELLEAIDQLIKAV
ncbi:hypothetical protein A0128_09545 [Leptospira tipperaryensis]|uniref:histidine kinase n=1 Tax=Leptospira tipperaryensis TaxID=2564040 RepID=A0A1D7UWV4_9LEPT|nr:response regulator [Leptospira tipperaryensis]AOP34064.1 hypothetical protein A0128_09545 [Leptospira tipperaryensis]